MPTSDKATVRRGRPRREGLDQAILNATVAEIARVGYARMSLEAIARLAETTKPTIYARFHSKARLVIAALESLRLQTPRRRSGDVRADLIDELALFRNGAQRVNGMTLLAAVLIEQHDHPELLKQFRESVVEPRRRNLRTILIDGQASGQLDPATDIELAITMLIGSLYAAYTAGTPTRRDWPEKVVDAWLRPNALTLR